MLKIIYCCIQAKVWNIFLNPGCNFLKAFSCLFHLNAFIYDHALCQSSHQCINYSDSSFRKFFPQFFCCHAGTVITSTYCRGQRDVQNILSLLQNLTKTTDCLIRIYLLCLWHRTISHLLIKCLRRHLFLMVRSISNTINRIIKGQNTDFIFLNKTFRQVCCIFCCDNKVFHLN